jgi:hypothetical protein
MTLLAFLAGLSLGCGVGVLVILATRANIHALLDDADASAADLDEAKRVSIAWHDAAMRWRAIAAMESEACDRLGVWNDLLLLRAHRGPEEARAMLRTLDEIAALPEREDER